MKQLSFLLVLSIIFYIQCCKKTTHLEDSNKIVSIEVKQRIDSTLQSFIDSGDIAGVSALIFEKGEEAYYNAFGFADKESQKPMQRNTLVQIFSMTKPITGTALMTLYEEGAFQLDDSLAKYAPEFYNMLVYKGVDSLGNLILEPTKRPITIRDITRHTAGFATFNKPHLGLDSLVRQVDATNVNNTLQEMAEKLGSLPLAFQPREEWDYGPSVDVQAFLVERISGIPYEDNVNKHVLDKLSTNETRYYVPEKNRNRMASVYHRNDEGVLTKLDSVNAYNFNFNHWLMTPGGFGLTSTLDDYMKFTQMLLNKGALNENNHAKT